METRRTQRFVPTALPGIKWPVSLYPIRSPCLRQPPTSNPSCKQHARRPATTRNETRQTPEPTSPFPTRVGTELGTFPLSAHSLTPNHTLNIGLAPRPNQESNSPPGITRKPLILSAPPRSPPSVPAVATALLQTFIGSGCFHQQARSNAQSSRPLL